MEDLLDLDQETGPLPARVETSPSTVVQEVVEDQTAPQTVPGEGSARRTVSETARRALDGLMQQDLMQQQELEPGAARRDDLQYTCVVCGRGRVRMPAHKCMECLNRST